MRAVWPWLLFYICCTRDQGGMRKSSPGSSGYISIWKHTILPKLIMGIKRLSSEILNFDQIGLKQKLLFVYLYLILQMSINQNNYCPLPEQSVIQVYLHDCQIRLT